MSRKGTAIPPGCSALALFAGLMILLPFFLANLMLGALSQLGLSPDAALLAAAGIFFGGGGTFDGIVLSGLVATLLA